MSSHRSFRRWRPAAVGTLAAGTAAAVGWMVTGAPTANAGSITGTLYRSPTSAAVTWVAANPQDARAATIRDRITTQPTARWYTSPDAAAIAGSVSAHVAAANAAGQIPQLIPYALPNRDCGGASAGGASTIDAYRQWMDNFARGLGDRTAIVLLEPDSLALQSCLDGAALAQRNDALATAVRTIKAANPKAKVYLDAGHSAWNPAADAARRLSAAGVSAADGFYTNVSNFRFTADEVAFGKAVLGVLNNPRLRQVIDTSRNGAGPLGSQWCDPAGRRIGAAPTTNTGEPSVDAFLWAKPPGESDGCRSRAGAFVPELAFELAGAGGGDATPGTPPTDKPATPPAPEPTKPATRPSDQPGPPVTPGPRGACAVTYRIDNHWSTGFLATITVTNRGTSAVDGWRLSYRFPGSQRVVKLWNGTVSQQGAVVTVRNVGYNARIAAGASVSLGFEGGVRGANGAATGFALNGVSCTRG